jgi:hypothetical protein
MSSTLQPSSSTVATIRGSIQNTLKTDLPPSVLANVIAPYLTSVNQWSSQIAAVLEHSDHPSAANLVFAIRKDLFIAPLFSQSVMGIMLIDLPAPFQEFMNFILKLIEAQKSEKDKPAVKVCSFPRSYCPSATFANLFTSLNVQAVSSNQRLLWKTMIPSTPFLLL